MQDLKVALIQTKQFWEDKTANFKHFEKTFFRELKPGEVDLILLPEMFNTGFTMNTTNVAEDMTGPSIHWLQKWAGNLNCQIGASLIIEEQGCYYNRFVIVGAEGILNYYDKRHLFRMANEQDHFTAGNRRVIHQLKGWKIMLQVCYDLRFPVFSRNQFREGQLEYDALFYIANWPEKRSGVWANLLRARATENQAYVVGVNRVGTDGNDIPYSGDSAVIDPWGNTQVKMEPNKECLRIITLNKVTLNEVRERFPAYLDSDVDYYFGESILTSKHE
jgi:predicted amidohydrolase